MPAWQYPPLAAHVSAMTCPYSAVPFGSTIAHAMVGYPQPPAQRVFQAPLPWQMSHASMANLHCSLAAGAHTQQPIDPMQPVVESRGGRDNQLAVQPAAAPRRSRKKDVKERQYSDVAFREMLTCVLRGDASARRVAADAQYPSAKRSLQRYVKDIRGNVQLPTIAAQLAHVTTLQLKEKGNPDLVSRRLFTEDELEYFARSLKNYADLGWPMDTHAIRAMFSTAARDMKIVDRGYVCSPTYVRNFIRSHKELTSCKASHIDPLRSKKASATVRGPAREDARTHTRSAHCTRHTQSGSTLMNHGLHSCVSCALFTQYPPFQIISYTLNILSLSMLLSLAHPLTGARRIFQADRRHGCNALRAST